MKHCSTLVSEANIGVWQKVAFSPGCRKMFSILLVFLLYIKVIIFIYLKEKMYFLNYVHNMNGQEYKEVFFIVVKNIIMSIFK